MAKKGLVLSNDDSRVTFTNTASLSIDDITENIVTNNITASVLKIKGIADNSNRLLNIQSNGTASSFPIASVNNSPLVWNGTSWGTTVSPIGTLYTGSAGGQLSGNIAEELKVLSVGGVTSGTLGTNYGGTGVSLTTNINRILKVSSSSGAVTYSALTSSVSGTLLSCIDNKFIFKYPSCYPDVRFYTASVSQNVFVWTRPTGAKFARVILQGAGGGGGGGSYGGAGNNGYGGGGGASGGYTDIIINISNIPTANITIGRGGAGGVGGTNAVVNSGFTGGATYFSSSVYYANGGGGGTEGNTTRSIGGTGISRDGVGGGGVTAGNGPEVAYNRSSGGGLGGNDVRGSSPGGTVVSITNNINYGYSLDSDGKVLNFINEVGAAGSNGVGIIPAKPGYGAGGGGGAASETLATASDGGPGGDGYALIISW